MLELFRICILLLELSVDNSIIKTHSNTTSTVVPARTNNIQTTGKKCVRCLMTRKLDLLSLQSQTHHTVTVSIWRVGQ